MAHLALPSLLHPPLWESWPDVPTQRRRVTEIPQREHRLSYESSPLAAVIRFHLTPSSPSHRLEAAGLSAQGRGASADCGSPAPITLLLWPALPRNKPKRLPQPLITSSALMNCEHKPGH